MDGLCVMFEGGDIVYLCFLGNVLEFWCYVESGSVEVVNVLVIMYLELFKVCLG